jgi:hypothetical protein
LGDVEGPWTGKISIRATVHLQAQKQGWNAGVQPWENPQNFVKLGAS